ncbi:MAG TPA: hypothetical protein DCZ23_07540 [Lachnospiraceae bacterium]|nr:hypothetical protein [Lachnospiraceae bacterium]
MPDISLDIPASGTNRKFLKKFLLIPAFLCLAVLVAYLAGVVYYQSHFFEGTNVYGTDVSKMKVEDFEKGLADYSLTIVQKDVNGNAFEETLSSSDLGISVSSTDELTKILKEQNAWKWPLKHNAVYAGRPTFITCDSEKVEEAVNSLRNMQKGEFINPKNAYLSDYKKGKGYEVVSEVNGNRLKKKALIEAVEDMVTSLGSSLDCDEAGLYKKPRVLSDNKRLNRLADRLNKYTSTNIKYEFGDNTEVLDGDIINKWISVKKGKISIDKTKISDFVASLRKKYDTIFRSREFKTSYGKTITITGGDYGWWMNTGEEEKELFKLIRKGEQGSRTPCYYQTADRYGTPDYGDTYVEVNLTEQHVFLYKDGELVLETDCVSGNSARGFDTPAGVYGITYKQRDATLNGENYSTPVSYWMPFNMNIGLHDANWRSSFGGQIYRTSGSHGCVNLPPDAARRIYDVVQAGTPVICYH